MSFSIRKMTPVATLLSLYFLIGQGYGQSSCPHQYTVQPPKDLACNPYPHRSVKMECAVTGSNLNEIRWYFSPTDMLAKDVLRITNSTKYTLLSVASSELLRVTLVVHDLNEENDTGTYYCRAFLEDGTILDSTSSLELQESDEYAAGITCPPNLVVKSSMSVCAIPYIAPAPPSPSPTPSPSPVPSPSSTHSSTALHPTTLSRVTVTTRSVAPTNATAPLPAMVTPTSSPVPILYIIIGLVGFLAILCVIMGCVICLLWRKARNKGSDQAMEFGCIPNETQSPKRSDFTIFPIDSSRSDISKGSNTDYAEIGPALMRSVRSHSANNHSHYAEINNIVSQVFSPSAPGSSVSDEMTSTSFQGLENGEHAYDEPDSTKMGSANGPPIHNYSKLKRKIPMIHVTSESDESEGEYYPDRTLSTTLWHNTAGVGMSNDVYASDQEPSETSGSSSCTFPPPGKLPTILEHPYHILEPSRVLFDLDYQSAEILQDESVSPTDSADCSKDDYDRLVNPEVYSTLDHSISNRFSDPEFLDVQSGPYSKLEPKASPRGPPKQKRVTKLSAEIFDDNQYLSPVPTPLLGASKTGVDVEARERDTKKYYGDYERDPIYMENIRSEKKATDMYQPLEVNGMDPIQDYEKYLKSQPTTEVIAME